MSDWGSGGRGFEPRQVRQHPFMEIDREIFSRVILSPTVSRRAASVSGRIMSTNTG